MAAREDNWSARESVPPLDLEAPKESYQQAAAQGEGRTKLVQNLIWQFTDFLRRSVSAQDGFGALVLSYVCPRCHCFSDGGLHVVDRQTRAGGSGALTCYI